MLGEGVALLKGFPHATQQGHVRWQCGCSLCTHTKIIKGEKSTHTLQKGACIKY